MLAALLSYPYHCFQKHKGAHHNLKVFKAYQQEQL